MKILITEFMDEAAVARLKQHCPDTHYNPKWVDEPASLLAAAADCDVLVVRNRTQVRGDLLAAAKQVSMIGRLGVGLDNIDVLACQARQIKVVPASGANALAVAEYVIGTAMLLLRASYQSTAAVSGGKWPRNALSNGRETAGKTLALIGYGDIGQRTARLARSLGMKTVAFDPILPADSPAWAETTAQSLEACLATADVVSLHVPYTEQTKNLLSRERLQNMKPGAILINTARGGLIDEPALAELLKSGHLGGAAIDVFGTEPYPANPMWEGIANLVLTPHIAGVSSEANVRVSEMIADAVIAHATTK